MEKQIADQIITEYLPKIYGFAMKKSFSYDEAEDLCADIVQEVYRSLLKSKEIVRLRREIAFLTKKRREIVYSFYYENKTVSQISKETGIAEGTVKWHLNKARNELKEGFRMERKIGKLGMQPIEAIGFGHNGNPGTNDGPEYYLSDKLNLNIVYSVYHSPKTKEEIAEELGVTLVFIEDKIDFLEGNGFLVPCSGNRYTTYVKFNAETYSLELEEKKLKRKLEIAEILAKEYAPLVREAIADVKDVYIPGGNRELLEAAAIFYGIANKCGISVGKDLSKYEIKTTAGGEFIAFVNNPMKQRDLDYNPTLDVSDYSFCGSMNRDSEKYPSVYSWSIDTRYSSREGTWQNNHTADYEYLYEVLTGTIVDDAVSAEKFRRLRQRKYLIDENQVNVMIVRGKAEEFFEKIPVLNEADRKKFADYALESAMLEAKDYPSQMQDLIISRGVGMFVGGDVALMVMDILYGNGTFKSLTERERITANVLMFSDILPEE